MRWIRRLLWIVKGMMLIVCLAILVLWVRSYSSMDVVNHLTFSNKHGGAALDSESVSSDRGWLRYATMSDLYGGESAAGVQARLARTPGASPGWNCTSREAAGDAPSISNAYYTLGPLMWHSGGVYTGNRTGQVWMFSAPHWFAALIVGAWPLLSIAFFIRRARRLHIAARRGLCRHCGYDLRADPEGAGDLVPRCPECGKERAATNAGE